MNQSSSILLTPSLPLCSFSSCWLCMLKPPPTTTTTTTTTTTRTNWSRVDFSGLADTAQLWPPWGEVSHFLFGYLHRVENRYASCCKFFPSVFFIPHPSLQETHCLIAGSSDWGGIQFGPKGLRNLRITFPTQKLGRKKIPSLFQLGLGREKPTCNTKNHNFLFLYVHFFFFFFGGGSLASDSKRFVSSDDRYTRVGLSRDENYCYYLATTFFVVVRSAWERR